MSKPVLNLPLINPIPDFEVGQFPTHRTVQELDGQAACAGWLLEPRNMNYIRNHPCYLQPVAQLVAQYDFDNFNAHSRGGHPRAIKTTQFIFWRILDWGCGLDPAVRSWLDQYCGGSVTAAIKSADPALLERIYTSHMAKPHARVFPAAPPMITGDVDTAESLFGMHPLPDIAVLVPFLIKKATEINAHPHDAVYFLNRCVTFLIRGGVEGAKLLAPYLPDMRTLADHLASLPEEGALAERSEYSDATVLEEARTGMKALLTGLDNQTEPLMYVKTIWPLEMLDEIYEDIWGASLREQTALSLELEGHTEDAITLLRCAWKAREQRHGRYHPKTIESLKSLAKLLPLWGDTAGAAEIEEIIKQRCAEMSGNEPT